MADSDDHRGNASRRTTLAETILRHKVTNSLRGAFGLPALCQALKPLFPMFSLNLGFTSWHRSGRRIQPAVTLLMVAYPAALVSCALVRGDRYSVRRAAQATTSGIDTIRIVNGSDHIGIIGRVGSSTVNAAVVIHGSSRKAVNSVRLVLERDGNVLELRADRPKRSWFSGDNPSVDLMVAVPSDLAVDVLDGSGPAHIDNVGAIKIRSGSGEVHVNNVAGPVDLVSGSGDAELSNIRGNLTAKVGSASMAVHGVSGSMDVRDADSGKLTIRNVAGSLHLGSIESGSLSADSIGGDLTVGSRGSGNVTYANVKGRVSVPGRYNAQ